MISLKVLIVPIPKLVVTIYHLTDYILSFLRLLMHIFRSDNFPIQCQCLFSQLNHSIWRGATKSI